MWTAVTLNVESVASDSVSQAMSSFHQIITVSSPSHSVRLAELGYKAVTVIALVFTVTIITLCDLLPWHAASSSRRIVATSRWIHPDSDPETWEPRTLPRSLRNRRQEDPDLINHIRDHWILRHPEGQRNLENNDTKADYSQYGQSTFFDTYLGQLERGFYVEAGAFDGEKFSDSLMLEVQRHWDGLLIEANPQIFKRLLLKKRHAYSLNACLSPTNRPMLLNYTIEGITSGITGLHKHDRPSRDASYTQIQCLPLYSILAAIGSRHIDLLLLDIEGTEFDVLQTLPLRDVTIDVINAEVLVNGEVGLQTERKMQLIESLLSVHGYKKLDTPFYLDMAMSKLRLGG